MTSGSELRSADKGPVDGAQSGKASAVPRAPGSLALTIELDRLPVALLFLLLEQFKASAGARQEQPEALAQSGEKSSVHGSPPRCRRPQTQEGPESRGQIAHRTLLSTSTSPTGHTELPTAPPSWFRPLGLCPWPAPCLGALPWFTPPGIQPPPGLLAP